MDTAAAVFFLISLVAFEVSIRVHLWFLSFFVYFVCFVVPWLPVSFVVPHLLPQPFVSIYVHSCPFVVPWLPVSFVVPPLPCP